MVTSGVWTNKLFPLLIRATKQQIVYFIPRDKNNFIKQKFPVFIYLNKGFYGFPIHGIDAVKISNHFPGKVIDPDMEDREVSEEFIHSCRAFFKEYIPSLADAEVVKREVCLYCVTPDEDFIIDKMDENIIIGVGFSGHGFKFAPIVGKILADLALDITPQYDISRFKLSRF